METHNYSCEEQ